jgi:hypothetical protein
MIFFGTSKEKSTNTELVPFETCSKCNTKDSTYVTTLIRYAHLYWIPLVPAGKRTVVFCNHCKANYNSTGLTAQGKAYCDEFESKQSYPWSYWTISLIILAIGAYMFLSFLFHFIVNLFR